MTLEQALDKSIAAMTTRFGDDWLVFDGFCVRSGSDCASPADLSVVYHPDSHAFYELFACVEGQCALQIGSCFCPIRAGDVAIVLPGTLHYEMSRQGDTYLGIWFSVGIDRCVLHLSGQSEQQGFFTLAGSSLQPERYAPLLQQMDREVRRQDVLASAMVKSSLVQLFIQARREIAAADHGQGRESGWSARVAADVIRYIEQNRSKPIRLEDVCHAVSMSGNYLNTLFKSVTGRTIVQYASEYKLEQAKLLLHQAYPIQEIAAMLGYYDLYHFSKAFKKATGQSPSRYRQTGDFTSAE